MCRRPTISAALAFIIALAAILAMLAAGVFSWGAPATATNIASLALLIAIFAPLALPPLRLTDAIDPRWLAPIVSIAIVGLAATAFISSVDPIPGTSAALLAISPLALLLMRLPALDPARGWQNALLAFIASIAAAGACVALSIAISEGWLAPQRSVIEEDNEHDDEWRGMFESWTPADG